MFFKLIIIIIVVYTIDGYSPDHYCKLGCNNNGLYYKHTVCERKAAKCGPAPACRGYIRADLTNSDRQQILDKHNEYRNKVAMGREANQPKAANMRVLKWDKELEYIAQCSANSCNFKHDKCRKTSNYGGVGQNIAINSQTLKFTPQHYINVHMEQIKNWYNEVKFFHPRKIHSFSVSSGPVTGHYTQLVWSDIESVGCGRTLYSENGWYNIYFVCNYAGRKTGGNLISAPVYISGQPCSQCPQRMSCNREWKGLCGNSVKIGKVIKKANTTDHRRENYVPFNDVPEGFHWIHDFIKYVEG